MNYMHCIEQLTSIGPLLSRLQEAQPHHTTQPVLTVRQLQVGLGMLMCSATPRNADLSLKIAELIRTVCMESKYAGQSTVNFGSRHTASHHYILKQAKSGGLCTKVSQFYSTLMH